MSRPTFDRLVEKGKKGQWAMAEAAFLVGNEATYGDGALARWAEEVGVAHSRAKNLARTWKLREAEGDRLTILSPSAAEELLPLIGENATPKARKAGETFLAENPAPSMREARAATEPYREKKQKSRGQVEHDTTLQADPKLMEAEKALGWVISVLPDITSGDEFLRTMLRRVDRVSTRRAANAVVIALADDRLRKS